jgi:flagellin
MSVVNTNVNASIAQAALTKNDRELSAAMQQLSTGRKINSAADNASGLAISARMTSQIRGLDQAVRNANDGVSMVQVAEGALDEIGSMLQRIRELAVQSGTGTTASADRSSLNTEFQTLVDEIDRIVDNTTFNGRNVLNAAAGGAATVSKVAFQVGAGTKQTISLTFGNFLQTGASGTFKSLASATLTLSAATTTLGITNASKVMVVTDLAIERVSKQRATFGAITNRLEHAIDNLTNVKTNTEASRSRILDTDYAESTSELARTQIIQQAGTAMLAQANALPATVLALLQ